MPCTAAEHHHLDDRELVDLVGSLSPPLVVRAADDAATRAGAALSGVATVSPVHRPRGASLASVAAQVHRETGGCAVVIGEGASGWEVAFTDHSLPTASTPPGWRPDSDVMGWSLIGETLGAMAGVAVGAGGTLLCVEVTGGSDGGGCALPLAIGVPVGAWGGAAVGASAATKTKKSQAVTGALVGTVVSIGSLVAFGQTVNGSRAASYTFVPIAIGAAPVGAGIAAGGREERSAVVSGRR